MVVACHFERVLELYFHCGDLLFKEFPVDHHYSLGRTVVFLFCAFSFESTLESFLLVASPQCKCENCVVDTLWLCPPEANSPIGAPQTMSLGSAISCTIVEPGPIHMDYDVHKISVSHSCFITSQMKHLVI